MKQKNQITKEVKKALCPCGSALIVRLVGDALQRGRPKELEYRIEMPCPNCGNKLLVRI